MTTVLITGGTGCVGTALCQHLVSLGWDVYCLLHRDPPKHPIKGVRYLTSLETPSSEGPYFEGVINLAGAPIAQRWTPRVRQDIYDSRILTTRQLVAYMAELPQKPRFFISGSAVGYYGTDPHKVFDDTHPYAPHTHDFAQHLCAAWEAVAYEAQVLGVRVVTLRMGPVLAKDGGMLAKLLPTFYAGLGASIGGGQQWLSWIDRDDLISLIVLIMTNPNFDGPVNATAPQPVTNESFSHALAAAMNRPCLLRIPAFLLKAVYGQMAEAIMLQGQHVVPQKALQGGFQFLYPTLESALHKIFR